MGRKNIIAALVLLGIGIGYGILTSRLPGSTARGVPGPAFFPWLVDICLLVLSAALLVQGIILVRREGAVRLQLPSWRVATTLILFVIYMAVLPFLGFIWASIPFFAALMMLYGARRKVFIVASSAGVPFFLFYLFGQVFKIPLPQGSLHILGL